MLSQPGQYACAERVTVVGPKKELAGVSILGPFRKASQVELSATDARSIGLPIVVRESGDLKGTPGCKLVGPKGELELTEGVIVAKRHIHATVNDAKELGVSDKEIVKVQQNYIELPLYHEQIVKLLEERQTSTNTAFTSKPLTTQTICDYLHVTVLNKNIRNEISKSMKLLGYELKQLRARDNIEGVDNRSYLWVKS